MTTLTFSLLYASACLIEIAAGGVTVIPGAEPKPYDGPAPVNSTDELFRLSARDEFIRNNASLLLTSYDPHDDAERPRSPYNPPGEEGIRPSSDSFVRGAIEAWGRHQHLVIRPEEVWFTILVQMNLYMNKHAEEIRHLFVDHEGKEEMVVKACCDWNAVLSLFKHRIQDRVKTKWLLDWIMPNFTTTTETDIMTANILMMGLTRSYFTFMGEVVCGLPSVTLLGEQEDWEALLAKLERLPDFGPEPAAYSERLKPILSRFVRSFQEPDSPATRTFWNQIVTAERGAGCGANPYYITGWITGFYFWYNTGERYGPVLPGSFVLDGISYPMNKIDTLPINYARAPLAMLNFSGMEEFPAYVLAGNIGKKITPGAPQGYADALKRSGNSSSLVSADDETLHGSLQPLSAWMLYGPVAHDAEVDQEREWEDYRDLEDAIDSNEEFCAIGANKFVSVQYLLGDEA